MINDEWYHCGDSLSEGVAFVHIELLRSQKPIHKSLWLQDDRDCHKFTIWNNKTIDWMICKEYLGIGDRLFLNLFRLCLDARTG